MLQQWIRWKLVWKNECQWSMKGYIMSMKKWWDVVVTNLAPKENKMMIPQAIMNIGHDRLLLTISIP
jgi:hypothetical protein